MTPASSGVHPDRPPSTDLVSPVLLLINTLGVGGAERYVVTVGNWFAERGADVTVAAMDGPMAADLRPDVRFIPTPLQDVRLSLPRAVLRVRRIIQEVRPQVVIANSLVVSWVARLARPARPVPMVTVAHGWPADRYRQVGPLIAVADRVVAVSPDVRQRLVDGGLDPQRCEVVFNGVDLSPFGRRTGEARRRARRAMGAGDDDIVVINVGRLSAQKAHHHVVAIAAALCRRLPAVRFAIAGDGRRRDELASRISAAGLEDRVRLLGARRDVPDLLGSADIYLSTSDWEGMPLSTIEAMASGLPIVATATEGSGQLLTPTSGVVVPVGDTDAMLQAVAELAEDPDRRAAMGTAARQRAIDHFSHDRMVGELAAIARRVAVGGAG
ncbi:MAG: glycosyltransferase family 1 protein [Deltaproteobacteria bacterium]|nr:MAG: glycosyltransferase family 1 protein [Deltaproteobacteria bacterium]